MKAVVDDLTFERSNVHFFTDDIPVKPRLGDVADKDSPDQTVSVRIENQFSRGGRRGFPMDLIRAVAGMNHPHGDERPVRHLGSVQNAFGAEALGLGYQGRIAAGRHDHLRKNRLVPMGHDIDMIGLDHPQIGLGAHRFRRAEENVGDFRGHHGADPAIGDGGLEALAGSG